MAAVDTAAMAANVMASTGNGCRVPRRAGNVVDWEGSHMRGKAAIFNAPKGRMEIRDVSLPPVEPDGILVRITRANVCGSDLHIWRGDTPLRAGNHIIGHEMVGQVAELGRNIRSD